MDLNAEPIRVVVFEDAGSLIAQCLEHDICVSAEDEETLKRRFATVFVAEWNLTLERHGEPLACIDPAPQEFHDMWDEADVVTLMSRPTPIAMAHAA